MSESGDGPSPATPQGDNPTENPSEPAGPEPTAGAESPAAEPRQPEEPFQPYLMAPPPAVEPPAPPVPPVPRPTPLDVAVELLPPRVTPVAPAQPVPAAPVVPPAPAGAPTPVAEAPLVPEAPAGVPTPVAEASPVPAEPVPEAPAGVPTPVAEAPPVPEAPAGTPTPVAEAPPVPAEPVPEAPAEAAAASTPAASTPAVLPAAATAGSDDDGEWTTVLVRRSAVATTATTIEAPAPPKKRGLSSLVKPAGGPQVLVLRIGILLLGLIILTTVFVGGTTVISRLRHNTATPTGSPTPSPTGAGFFPYSDPVHQFSIERPGDWNGRQLATPVPNVVLLIGPNPPFPVTDFAFIRQYNLTETLTANDLFPLQQEIEGHYLDKSVNIFHKAPSPIINGLNGWYYEWSTSPSTTDAGSLNAGYFLIDGNRLDIIQLLVVPLTDNRTFVGLLPTFQSMAQTFQSFHQSGAATPPSTASPQASASP